MAVNKNVESRRRARKARKRTERRRGEVRKAKARRCTHAAFPSRFAAVSYGVRKYGSVRVPAKCPNCGKFAID